MYADLQRIVNYYRRNHRMKSHGLDDVDDLFIAGHILRSVNTLRGRETLLTVRESGQMSWIFEDMQIDYEAQLNDIKSGDFWDEYIDDEEPKFFYDYELFRQAIRNANAFNSDIHVTNMFNYIGPVLYEYKILLIESLK